MRALGFKDVTVNNWLIFSSILIGCGVCYPLFKYMYNAVFSNAPDFDGGYKKVVKRDATDDFIRAHGSRDSTVNSFVFANVFVLLLPLIPACFVAVPIYFALSWAIGVIST